MTGLILALASYVAAVVGLVGLVLVLDEESRNPPRRRNGRW